MAKNQITSVWVDDSGLEWTTVRRQRGRLEAVKSAQSALPAAAVGDEAQAEAQGNGHAVDAAVVAECRKIDGAISLAVPATRSLLRVLKLPAVDEEERTGMIELQADKLSPFPAESTVVSHEILSESDGQHNVLMAAIPTALADAYGARLRNAGIRPAGVDIDLLGWWRLIQDDEQTDLSGRVACMIVQPESCSLVVSENGVALIFRTLDGTAGVDADGFNTETMIELRHTLTSLEVEHGPCALSAVKIWHEGEEPTGLIGRMRSDAEAGTVSAAPLDSLPPLSEGLARRQLTSAHGIIDLVPVAWRAAERARRTRFRMIGGGVAVLVIWVAVVAVVLGLRQRERGRLAERQAWFDELADPHRAVGELRRRVNLLQHFTVDRPVSLDCLDEVSRALPQGVVLSSYAFDPEETRLVGVADSADPVFDFKEKLDAVGLFQSVRLDGPTKKDGREHFRIRILMQGSSR